MITTFTPFTADRSILAGGLALAQGVGSGLSNLGEGIAKMMEQKKQRNARAKASEALFKATPELQKAVGMDPEDFSALSADEKTEVVGHATAGLKLRQALDQAAQSKRLDEALMQEREARAQGLREALANQQQEPAFLGRMNELMQPHEVPVPAGQEGPPELQPGQPNLGALLRASQETGYRPDLRGVLDDMIKNGGSANGADTFVEDPTTGARFLSSGKTRLPSGTNPAKAPKEAEELFDPEGNVIGHRVPIGGGKFTFRPAKPAATGELLPVLDPTTRRPVPGLGMDAAGKVHDYRNIMQKSGMGGSAEPAADERVTVTKDGKRFTLPKSQLDAAKKQGYTLVK